MHEQTFLTIFHIAMDYLLVQASAMPCERVFSSSAETDTKKRNCIKPELMEVLQILEFALKKEHLNFSSHLILSKQALTITEAPATDALTELLRMNPQGLDTFLNNTELTN